ncbi:UDP-glucuronate 4-epimerase [Methylohalomonas lacus]|uniref:UDP-glucuronate 4-epimerase n=1 Tax=Methylohalomonas lacus TaxID=398773 RepID=A0AAE3HNH8_9GAMM|nr:NAD-dependent epimerase [Methylohalomonas lacus]MCS3904522.1 UDP-glucuronate 4-epimerase [Methylohalomonas lacus]
MKVIVTGAAGFIGYHTAKHLLERGNEVIGIDSLNDYYDVQLKRDRLAQIDHHRGFDFHHLDLADRQGTAAVFEQAGAERVIHLAAQAGVRYSLENPHAYVDSNLMGFINVLEACRHNNVGHLVYASSSSVYGANSRIPYSVHDNVDHPVSLYAATKKANELMAHTYSHLYAIPVTGLRFFTVYGPWGRPDMAYFSFTKKILAGEPIDVFNHGDLSRDFTYIDDIVAGVVRALDRIPQPNPDWNGDRPDPGTSSAPYRLYNIGHHSPVRLLDFIAVLEQALGRKAEKRMQPMQPGDVYQTCADIDDFTRDVGYTPVTDLEHGIPKFIDWYKDYYGC